MADQTTYSAAPTLGLAGSLYSAEGARALSRVAEVAAIVPGDFVIRGTTDPQATKIAAVAPAAANNLIIASGVASATTKQTISGAGLNGSTGATRVWPPRNVTIVLNSHADWNDTVAQVNGLDDRGNAIAEEFVIPEGGNVTLTGKKFFSQITNLVLPACGGTNGTVTMGLGTDLGPIDGRSLLGIAAHDPGLVSGNNYAINDVLSVWRKGIVNVYCEDAATAGAPVYCRMVVGGVSDQPVAPLAPLASLGSLAAAALLLRRRRRS